MPEPLNILVAEDDLPTRRLIVKLLQSDGHHVHEAENGENAWVHFNANPTHVIVSDWMMPDCDGLDLCRRVRGLKRDEYTYFILLTSASRNRENIRESFQAGVDDFLTKPINPDDMWMRVRVAERILNFHGQVRALEAIIPICAYCKKVRDDSNLWQAVDTYLAAQTGRDLSHSICPECYKQIVQAEIDAFKKAR